MLEVTIHVPADIAARWQTQGDLPRDVLEAAALEAYPGQAHLAYPGTTWTR